MLLFKVKVHTTEIKKNLANFVALHVYFSKWENRIVLTREKLDFFAAQRSNVSIKSGSNLRAAKAIRSQGRDVAHCSDD